MAIVLIEYNSNDEMMSITRNGECAFYGNYWDFDREPHGIQKFLRDINVNAIIKENKGLGKVHPDELHEDYER